MTDWLKSRLSPVKSETDRWTELAETIQQLWEENSDPYLDRQNRLRSIFTASDADKILLLHELGKYYDVDIQDANIPIAVIQRRMELFQKDSLVPLEASLRRACPGIDIRWRPEYHRRGSVYGSLFYTEEMLARLGKTAWLTNVVLQLDGKWSLGSQSYIPLNYLDGSLLDGSWLVGDVVAPDAAPKLIDAVLMTSRGKLWIDETTISNPAITEESLRDRMMMVKPLHIVLDGIIWECLLNVGAGFEFLEVSAINAINRVHVSWNLRLDGSWKLGLNAHTIRVDGSWFLGKQSDIPVPIYYLDGRLLDGSWLVGEKGPRALWFKALGELIPLSSQELITNTSVWYHGDVDSQDDIWISQWYLPNLAAGYKLDGAWGVGRRFQRFWPQVDLQLYLDDGLFLDGTWLVGGEI